MWTAFSAEMSTPSSIVGEPAEPVAFVSHAFGLAIGRFPLHRETFRRDREASGALLKPSGTLRKPSDATFRPSRTPRRTGGAEIRASGTVRKASRTRRKPSRARRKPSRARPRPSRAPRRRDGGGPATARRRARPGRRRPALHPGRRHGRPGPPAVRADLAAALGSSRAPPGGAQGHPPAAPAPRSAEHPRRRLRPSGAAARARTSNPIARPRCR